MEPFKIALIVTIWLSTGIIGVGFDNAYYQRKFSASCNGREELGRAILSAYAGPIDLVTAFLLSGFGRYGWSLSSCVNPGCCK